MCRAPVSRFGVIRYSLSPSFCQEHQTRPHRGEDTAKYQHWAPCTSFRSHTFQTLATFEESVKLRCISNEFRTCQITIRDRVAGRSSAVLSGRIDSLSVTSLRFAKKFPRSMILTAES